MKEKLKEKINIDFVVAFTFFILVGSVAFFVKVDFNDELWNFSNIYKMCNGYVIYKDLNVIVTPLFFYIGKLFLKVFGQNYLSFRIYNFIIYFLFYNLIYKVFKALKINKVNSFAYTVIIYLFTYVNIRAGANYNCLAIVFCLLGVLLTLKIDKNKWYSPYLQGIIIFLIFVTKQNIAVFYFAGSFISCFIITIYKRDIKNQIISWLKQVVTIFSLILCLAIVMLIQNNLYEFIDFCILGISEFASRNTYFAVTSITIITLNIISIIFSVLVLIIKNVDKDVKNNNIIILPLSICLMFMAFPILNQYHLELGSILSLILLIYNLNHILIMQILNERKIKKVYTVAIVAIILCSILFFIKNNITYYNKLDNSVSIYYGSMINEEQKDSINKICKFINENESNGIEVKIVSCKSNFYMNVLNKNNGVLDLPFYGNFGRGGEQSVIEYISKSKDKKFLIQKEDKLPWQESEEIRNYIKQNLKYEGEIEDFLIYSK